MFPLQRKKDNKSKTLKEFYDIKDRLLKKCDLQVIQTVSSINYIKQNFNVSENWSDYIVDSKQVSYRLLCNAFELIDGIDKRIICIDNLCEKGAKFIKQKHKNAEINIFLTKGTLEIELEKSPESNEFETFKFESTNTEQPLKISKNTIYSAKALDECVFVVKFVMDF